MKPEDEKKLRDNVNSVVGTNTDADLDALHAEIVAHVDSLIAAARAEERGLRREMREYFQAMARSKREQLAVLGPHNAVHPKAQAEAYEHAAEMLSDGDAPAQPEPVQRGERLLVWTPDGKPVRDDPGDKPTLDDTLSGVAERLANLTEEEKLDLRRKLVAVTPVLTGGLKLSPGERAAQGIGTRVSRIAEHIDGIDATIAGLTRRVEELEQKATIEPLDTSLRAKLHTRLDGWLDSVRQSDASFHEARIELSRLFDLDNRNRLGGRFSWQVVSSADDGTDDELEGGV